MKTLTKVEEQVMQQLWGMGTAFLKELTDSFPEPKPAYTTVSTMLRILIQKEFIGYKMFGSNRQYYPLISREEYLKGQFKGVLGNYFQGSFSKFASFYASDKDLSMAELKEIEMIIKEQIEKRNL
jgi:predicted transcriptional regulator